MNAIPKTAWILVLLTCLTSPLAAAPREDRNSDGQIILSSEHLAAVNRPRRVICNFDTNFGAPSIAEKLAGMDVDDLAEGFFSMVDEPGVKIDSIWWCWLDGNYANYPSQVLPVWELPGLKKWWDQGVDPIRVFDEQTKKRNLESFFSYRINGTDMNLIQPLSKPLLKHSHPDWLIRTWEAYENPGYWNFAIPEVRDYKLAILREIAENYDFDGIEIDFARIPICLPLEHQWENRQHLTEFMRAIRMMTLEVARQRGRPFLLAARVPENLVGCHFDGMDVEAWSRENLVDMFVLGNRSLDADIQGFRHITRGTSIKLYPCHDVHHASDGYEQPVIEIHRGVFANWMQQGADGMQTFNYTNWTAPGAAVLGFDTEDWLPSSIVHDLPVWTVHRHAYRDFADLEALKHKDKTFVVQRRGGGHGATVIPDPAHWTTPRRMYFLTNMLAPLPAGLANNGNADTLLFVAVGDDLSAESEQVRSVSVAVLLSDPEAADLKPEQRLEIFQMASHDRPQRKRANIPPRIGIENQIELRLNNIHLGKARIDRGWLVFNANPRQFAVGDNLIGLRVAERADDASQEIQIEMVEVRVKYR